MSTTNCTSTPCTQYGHTGVRSAGTQSKDLKCAHSEGTHGARRGRMLAMSCSACVYLRGRGNAAAHQCGATAHRETDATSRHASAARATQSRRTPRRRQPHQPRTAAPHPPSTRDGSTRDAAATRPRRQTRTQPTARRATTELAVARTRACGPRPPQPPPTHGPPCAPFSIGGSPGKGVFVCRVSRLSRSEWQLAHERNAGARRPTAGVEGAPGIPPHTGKCARRAGDSRHGRSSGRGI